MNIETLAVHAGHNPDPHTGAVTPPIHLSTTFERAADGSYPGGHMYTRNSNPNRDALEAALGALEGGAAATAFASGSAATLALFQALAPGDHVIVTVDAYYGTLRILRDIFGPWKLEASFVDTTDLAAVRAALRPNTRLVVIESPSNPLLKITDIAAVAEIAKRAGARVACDNTWGTPLLTRPLDLGCDIALHATTKYIGGHSDVIGGALVFKTNDGFFQRVRTIQLAGGAVPSAFDCWLVARGLRSLHCRMRTHCENAMVLAQFLATHPRVEAVYYPGLESHPGHAIAKIQMKRFGGMLAFQVKGGAAEAMAVAAAVSIFTRATSLGGVESLIEHRASIEGAATRAPQNLLRVSVGLENVEDLKADLASALESR